MFSCAGMARRARARSRSGRVGCPTDRVSDRPPARTDWRSGSGAGSGGRPPRGTRRLSHDSSFPANHARRARPRSTALARASPFLHTRTMSALLASSFVGRVAAFKATKVQVRTVFFFVDRRWSSSLARRVARDDANGRARAREIRSARAVVVRWTTRDDAIGARAR